MMDTASSLKEQFAKFLKQQLAKKSTSLVTQEKAYSIRSYLQSVSRGLTFIIDIEGLLLSMLLSV